MNKEKTLKLTNIIAHIIGGISFGVLVALTAYACSTKEQTAEETPTITKIYRKASSDPTSDIWKTREAEYAEEGYKILWLADSETISTYATGKPATSEFWTLEDLTPFTIYEYSPVSASDVEPTSTDTNRTRFFIKQPYSSTNQYLVFNPGSSAYVYNALVGFTQSNDIITGVVDSSDNEYYHNYEYMLKVPVETWNQIRTSNLGGLFYQYYDNTPSTITKYTLAQNLMGFGPLKASLYTNGLQYATNGFNSASITNGEYMLARLTFDGRVWPKGITWEEGGLNYIELHYQRYATLGYVDRATGSIKYYENVAPEKSAFLLTSIYYNYGGLQENNILAANIETYYEETKDAIVARPGVFSWQDGALKTLYYDTNAITTNSVYIGNQTTGFDIGRMEEANASTINPLFTNQTSIPQTLQLLSTGSSGDISDQIGLGNSIGLLGLAFSSLMPILSLQIFPGVTLGLLIFTPLIAAIIVFVLHALAK